MHTPKQVEPCHPSRTVTSCTCFSHDQLTKIAQHLKKSGYPIDSQGSQKQLWKRIHSIMKDKCRSDWCWPSHPLIKNIADREMTRKTFRPRAPDDWVLHDDAPENDKGRFVWLSNFDIDAVLAQYEETDEFKDFKLFKSVPIDFEAIKDPLSRVNIFQLQKDGINRFGVVFNLDKHNMPGSHWVSIYVSILDQTICFFDSYAKIPEPEIQDFMAKICIQALLGFDGKSIDRSRAFEMTPLFNVTRHQYLGSECGSYSLYMIIRMLNGGSAQDFFEICKNKIDDMTMNSFRKRLFIDGGKTK